MEVASPPLSSQHNPSTFSTMQTECDEEFEEITDGLTRVILTTAILDIDEMLLEQQWKRLPGNGSKWEQALVRHKLELQQGLAGIKERLRRISKEEAIAVDMKKIPSIVVQKPDIEDDTKVIEAFEGDASSPQHDVKVGKVPQRPSAAPPQSQVTPQDFNSSVSSSTLVGPTPSSALKSLTPPAPAPGTTEEFAYLMKGLLEPGTDDENPNSTHAEIKLQIEGESIVEVTAVEQSTRSSIINPNVDIADMYSITQLAAPAAVEFIERSSTEFARGHKRSSDEAGLDERATSNQMNPTEQDEEVETPPKKRKDMGDSEIPEMTPPELLPKTPAKGNTLRVKPKATPASVRRSKRQL